MTSIEFLTEILQEILGAQYMVRANHAFQQEFIKPMQTPYGTSYDVDYQAFAEHSDTIIAVVETRPLEASSAPYILENSTYTVSFWVPVDVIPAKPEEVARFDFNGDMEKLRSEVKNKALYRTENGVDYRAFLSIGEPYLASTQAERSGAYMRVVMQVAGNISIAESAVRSGEEIRIVFVRGETEFSVENPLNLSVGATTSANQIQAGDSVQAEQNVAIVAQAISFAVDDWTENPALAIIEEKAWKNTPVLSPDEEGDKKYKILTRLYKGETLMREFWGILEAQYTVSGKTGYGRYTVNVVCDERSEEDGGV